MQARKHHAALWCEKKTERKRAKPRRRGRIWPPLRGPQRRSGPERRFLNADRRLALSARSGACDCSPSQRFKGRRAQRVGQSQEHGGDCNCDAGQPRGSVASAKKSNERDHQPNECGICSDCGQPCDPRVEPELAAIPAASSGTSGG